jgi:hypothetical protein
LISLAQSPFCVLIMPYFCWMHFTLTCPIFEVGLWYFLNFLVCALSMDQFFWLGYEILTEVKKAMFCGFVLFFSYLVHLVGHLIGTSILSQRNREIYTLWIFERVCLLMPKVPSANALSLEQCMKQCSWPTSFLPLTCNAIGVWCVPLPQGSLSCCITNCVDKSGFGKFVTLFFRRSL